MRHLIAFLFVVLAAAVAAQPPPTRGIVLPLYAADPTMDYAPLLDEIATTGANAVSLAVVLMQEDAYASRIDEVPGRTVPEAALRRTLAHARALKLDVMVFPIVLLKHADNDEWRGSIEPADIDAWWASYTAHITRLARIAREEGAAWLSIGSEFSSLEDDADRWTALIRAARAEFPGGRLLYSANWDRLDGPAEWWDGLDAIGLSAYYELTDDPEAPLSELAAAWTRQRDAILQWRASAGLEHLPLVMTELGYPSMDGGAVYPWDYTLNKPVDLREQQLAYQAFIHAWDGRAELGGVYFYKWVGFEERPEAGYSPRGKPAEWVLRAWLGGGEALPTSTPETPAP